MFVEKIEEEADDMFDVVKEKNSQMSNENKAESV
jgi:hypothetical protein